MLVQHPTGLAIIVFWIFTFVQIENRLGRLFHVVEGAACRGGGCEAYSCKLLGPSLFRSSRLLLFEGFEAQADIALRLLRVSLLDLFLGTLNLTVDEVQFVRIHGFALFSLRLRLDRGLSRYVVGGIKDLNFLLHARVSIFHLGQNQSTILFDIRFFA